MTKKSALPTRIVNIPKWGPFEVAMYITRLDYPRKRTKAKRGAKARSHGATHAWWVRYQGASKCFSDGEGTPAQSLARATRYLTGIYVGPSMRLARKEHADKKDKTGMPGVRIVEMLKPGRRTPEIAVEVSGIHRGESPKRIYVGTGTTANPARLKRALREAKAIRQERILAYIETLGSKRTRTRTAPPAR